MQVKGRGGSRGCLENLDFHVNVLHSSFLLLHLWKKIIHVYLPVTEYNSLSKNSTISFLKS